MSTIASMIDDSRTLRLVWPQWQGGESHMVAELMPEFPVEQARRGYAVGSRVLDAILPEHSGPTIHVPVSLSDPTEGVINGIESRSDVLESLGTALDLLADADFDRVLTLGGECSVSVAPFARLAKMYGDDLAVIWIDSHPDVDTPETDYDGYHAMAVTTLTGHGDKEIVDMLPATIATDHVALTGLHDWTEDAYAHVGQWGISAFAPDDLRQSAEPLIKWLSNIGASKVAVHIDVDAIDSNDAKLGLARVPNGLTRADAHNIIIEVSQGFDIVGLTVAEFIPRSVLSIQQMLNGLPLIGV
jgi:arginase